MNAPGSKPMPHTRPAGRKSQRGNILIFALLGLILTGLTAAAVFQSKALEMKGGIGRAEATVLDKLRTAANNAVIDFMFDIQAGRSLSRAVEGRPGSTVTIVPSGTAPDLVWKVSPQQLADLGYLPGSWAHTTSSINGAGYEISWRRRRGCVTGSCDIEGEVVLMGPIRDPGDPAGTMDGVVIGPILTHFGADGGVSLLSSSGSITGYDGHFWDVANPVAGTPPGVVAARFGTASSLMSRFVRRGDTRDPNLAGPLTVEGAAALNGGVSVRGGVQVVNGAGKVCTTLTPEGEVNLGCGGRLSATQGVFTDGNGNRTSLSGTEVMATGKITGGDVVATKNLAGQRLELQSVVAEGTACTVTGSAGGGAQYAQLPGGGLAMCSSGGRWIALNRFAAAGATCAKEGAFATDPADGQGLVCRHGLYARASALMSNFVLVETVEVALGTAGPTLLAKPVCPASGGAAPVQVLMLAPSHEAPPISDIPSGTSVTTMLSGINRYAEDRGDQWAVHLRNSGDGSALPGTLVASIYCFYP